MYDDFNIESIAKKQSFIFSTIRVVNKECDSVGQAYSIRYNDTDHVFEAMPMLTLTFKASVSDEPTLNPKLATVNIFDEIEYFTKSYRFRILCSTAVNKIIYMLMPKINLKDDIYQFPITFSAVYSSPDVPIMNTIFPRKYKENDLRRYEFKYTEYKKSDEQKSVYIYSIQNNADILLSDSYLNLGMWVHDILDVTKIFKIRYSICVKTSICTYLCSEIIENVVIKWLYHYDSNQTVPDNILKRISKEYNIYSKFIVVNDRIMFEYILVKDKYNISDIEGFSFLPIHPNDAMQYHQESVLINIYNEYSSKFTYISYASLLNSCRRNVNMHIAIFPLTLDKCKESNIYDGTYLEVPFTCNKIYYYSDDTNEAGKYLDSALIDKFPYYKKSDILIKMNKDNILSEKYNTLVCKPARNFIDIILRKFNLNEINSAHPVKYILFKTYMINNEHAFSSLLLDFSNIIDDLKRDYSEKNYSIFPINNPLILTNMVNINGEPDCQDYFELNPVKYEILIAILEK